MATKYEATRERCMEFQAESLASWSRVLTPEVFAVVKREVLATNSPNQPPMRIMRGDAITEYVLSLACGVNRGHSLEGCANLLRPLVELNHA